MSWKFGIAAPVFVLVTGCAIARSASSPTPNTAAGALAPTLESVVGSYKLVAVDGRPLPFTPAVRGDASTSDWPIIGGTLALRTDGTFRIETSYNGSVEGGKESSFAFSGSCFSIGREIQMVWDGGGQTDLTVHGDTVLLSNSGKLFSYIRR